MPNKGGFSWKRATGITKAKQKISRSTGVPWTKSGRQRKVGSAMSKGCVLILLTGVLGIILVLFGLSNIRK